MYCPLILNLFADSLTLAYVIMVMLALIAACDDSCVNQSTLIRLHSEVRYLADWFMAFGGNIYFT